MIDLDYENDWSGECRIDEDGNGYVLRAVAYTADFRPAVLINDIFGGHMHTILLDDWLQWPVAE